MTLARWLRAVTIGAALFAAGCTTMSTGRADRAQGVAFDARDRVVTCERPSDWCATPSTLRDLGDRAFSESTDSTPRHYAILLDRGPDALLARINLIRAARTSIDLQTYIFDEDDTGHFVLDELMAAGRKEGMQ